MLVKAALRESLRPLFESKTMPRGNVTQAVQEWVRAYIPYAQGALAGACLPAGFVAGGGSGRFSTALDSALRTMWLAVTWAAPGLVGKTTVVPPLAPVLEANSAVLITSRDPEQALSLITESLHTYTSAITVTITPPAGAPFIVPLT